MCCKWTNNAWNKFLKYLLKSSKASTFALLRQTRTHLFIVRQRPNYEYFCFYHSRKCGPCSPVHYKAVQNNHEEQVLDWIPKPPCWMRFILRCIENPNSSKYNFENTTGWGRYPVFERTVQIIISHFPEHPIRSLKRAMADLGISYSTMQDHLKKIIHMVRYKTSKTI